MLYHGHAVGDLNSAESVETFYEKELQKTNQTEFSIEKVIKKKVKVIGQVERL